MILYQVRGDPRLQKGIFFWGSVVALGSPEDMQYLVWLDYVLATNTGCNNVHFQELQTLRNVEPLKEENGYLVCVWGGGLKYMKYVLPELNLLYYFKNI